MHKKIESIYWYSGGVGDQGRLRCAFNPKFYLQNRLRDHKVAANAEGRIEPQSLQFTFRSADLCFPKKSTTRPRILRHRGLFSPAFIRHHYGATEWKRPRFRFVQRMAANSRTRVFLQIAYFIHQRRYGAKEDVASEIQLSKGLNRVKI